MASTDATKIKHLACNWRDWFLAVDLYHLIPESQLQTITLVKTERSGGCWSSLDEKMEAQALELWVDIDPPIIRDGIQFRWMEYNNKDNEFVTPPPPHSADFGNGVFRNNTALGSSSAEISFPNPLLHVDLSALRKLRTRESEAQKALDTC